MRVACLFAVLLVALGSTPSKADTVHLQTGESIRGRALSDLSNEEVLVLRDYATGNLRRLRWDSLAADRWDAYARAWGWLDSHYAPVDGVRLTRRLEDGSTQVLTGLPEEGGRAEMRRLRVLGTPIDMPREDVVVEERALIDPRTIWSPDQLHARFLESLEREGVDPAYLTAGEALRVASAAYWALDLDRARAFAALAAEESSEARELLAHADALATRTESLAVLRAALAHVRQGRLGAARAARGGLPALHEESEPAMREQLEGLDTELRETLVDLASERVPKIAKSLIEEKIRGPEVSLAASLRWAERDLERELFVSLASALAPTVGTVSPIELRLAWLDRSHSHRFRRASYGAGTLVVAPDRDPSPDARSSDAGPDAQAWWDQASSRERAGFLLAVFAESSGTFEASAGRGRPCILCSGSGAHRRRLPSGEIVEHLCPRCAGAREDREVRYR